MTARAANESFDFNRRVQSRARREARPHRSRRRRWLVSASLLAAAQALALAPQGAQARGVDVGTIGGAASPLTRSATAPARETARLRSAPGAADGASVTVSSLRTRPAANTPGARANGANNGVHGTARAAWPPRWRPLDIARGGMTGTGRFAPVDLAAIGAIEERGFSQSLMALAPRGRGFGLRRGLDPVGVERSVPALPVVTPSVIAPPQTAATPAPQPTTAGAATRAETPSRAAVNVAGVSVLASASYDDTQMQYIPDPTGDQVVVFGQSAIIDWTTNQSGAPGTQVTFLPAGNNLGFSSQGPNDFTVLNRVLTPGFDSAIRIDGNVSTLGQNGRIWFYSAGGIVIGSTASFNVGSLLLTSSAIDPASIGSNTISFTGVSDPASAVVIEPGATINAPLEGSYVAMVAPRVEQGGTVDVNGSVAYVGAETATLTMANGLFDIAVGLGTDDANGVVHTGTTTGDASNPTLDVNGNPVPDGHGIYMVAVPKNTAISMLVGGTIGYRPASAAALGPNGSIILSAGSSVTQAGSIDSPDVLFDAAQAAAGGSIDIGGVNFDSQVFAFASESFEMMPAMGEIVRFSSDARNTHGLNLKGAAQVILGAGRGGLLDIAGDLVVRADIGGTVSFDAVGVPTGPGDPLFGAGSVTIGGNLTIDASAIGAAGDSSDPVGGNGGVGGDALAANVSFTVGPNSPVSIGGSLVIDASAQGGAGDVTAGGASAGDVTISITDGNLNVAGSLVINAGARAANVGQGSLPASSRDNRAGNVNLTMTGGTLSATSLSINTNAQGTSAADAAIAGSGGAFAGSVLLDVQNGAVNLTNLDIFGAATAGSITNPDPNSGPFRGQAGRGRAQILVSNSASFTVQSGSFINVNAEGQVVGAPDDAVVISVQGNSDAGLSLGSFAAIETGAFFGTQGITTQAGSVRLVADGGTLGIGDLFVNAFASAQDFGSATPSGDNFRGGDLGLLATNGGQIVGTSLFADLSAAGSSRGGDATGGDVTIDAIGGTIDLTNSIDIDATGYSGTGIGANGAKLAGVGSGGQITVNIGTGGMLGASFFSLRNDGSNTIELESGSFNFDGDGSQGVGGNLTVNLNGGTLDIGTMFISSSGFGGFGGEGADTGGAAAAPRGASGFVSPGTTPAGSGGVGQGGNVTFNLTSGTATIGDLTVEARGVGGGGATGFIDSATSGGNGGDGIGGNATFNATGGTLDVTGRLTVSAEGEGGSGGSGLGTGGGDAGNAQGGIALFNLDGTSTISANQVVVTAAARGGFGGRSFDTLDQQNNFFPDAGGGRGGDAIGGTAQFIDTAGSLTFTSMSVDARGTGGDGGDSTTPSAPSSGVGGDGGNGQGGIASVALNQDNPAARGFTLLAVGAGGNGGFGAGAGSGGRGDGGTAQLDVNNVSVGFSGLVIDARGLGGNGANFSGTDPRDGANGGDAQGGLARIVFDGPNAAYFSQGSLAIDASALGGNGAAGGDVDATGQVAGNGGNGGSATGGAVQFSAVNGANVSIDADLTTLNADGLGGNGGDGGDDFVGGTTGNGGRGGDGAGGAVEIIAGAGSSINAFVGGGSNSRPANGSNAAVASNPFVLSVTGRGGAGGFGGDSSTPGGAGVGGDGGDGTGGSPRLRALGGALTSADFTLNANGIGGNGGGAGDGGGGSNGNGGSGFGGTPMIENDSAGGAVTLGITTVNANGIAGTGQTPGITAGGSASIINNSTDPAAALTFDSLTVNALGAIAPVDPGLTIRSNGGPIAVINAFIADLGGSALIAMDGDGQMTVGTDATINSGQDLVASHSNNAGSIPALDVGGDLSVDVQGNIDSGAIFSAVNASFNAGSQGNLGTVLTSADISAFAPVITADLLDAGGDIFLRADASADITEANAGGLIDILVANGPLNAGLLTTISGDIDLEARGMTLGTLDSGDWIVLDFDFGALEADQLIAAGWITDDNESRGVVTRLDFADAGGDFSFGSNGYLEGFNGGEINAANNVIIETESGGNILADRIVAGNDVRLVTFGATGNVTVGTIAADPAAGLIDVNAQGAIEIGSLSGFAATLLSRASNVTVTQNVALDALNGLLTAEGEAVSITSTDAFALDATARSLDIFVDTQSSLFLTAAAAGDVDVTAGTLFVNGANGTNITLSARGNMRVDGDVTADQAVTLDATNVTLRTGTVSGLTIGVTVRDDLDVLSGSALGDATRTQVITINFGPDAKIGGVYEDCCDFELENEDFSRIHSGGDIIFNQSAQSPGGGAFLTIDTLDVIAGDGTSATGQNIGQNGALVFNSDGAVEVIGPVDVDNASAQTRLSISALEDIFVDLETGGLFVLDGNAGLAGTIDLSARDIFAMTASAFSDIQTMTLSEIDQRLAQSDGVDRPDGVIRADTLNIDTTASQVFIQNSVPGTDFDQRRGFAVNTLNISDSGGTVQPIVINGVVNGNTGAAAIPATNITSSFDPASTINGCLIIDPSACGGANPNPNPNPNPDDIGSDDPIRDQIDDELNPQKSAGDGEEGDQSAMFATFMTEDEYENDPLIDEPVTGAGNEDLWDDEDECAEESGEACEIDEGD